MTEPLFNLASIQRNTLEVVFEQFGFQSFYSAPAPEFAMHKWAADNPGDVVAQSLSGVVLDAGYSFTHAVPIFDGRILRPAVKRIRLGGKLLTNLMKEWVSFAPCWFTDLQSISDAMAL
jgi:actin-related protein 6